MAFLPEPLIFVRSISSSLAIFLTAGPAFIPLKSMEAALEIGCTSSAIVVCRDVDVVFSSAVFVFSVSSTSITAKTNSFFYIVTLFNHDIFDSAIIVRGNFHSSFL